MNKLHEKILYLFSLVKSERKIDTLKFSIFFSLQTKNSINMGEERW